MLPRESPTRLLFRNVWGSALAFLDRSRRIRWVDLAILVALGGLLYGLILAAQQATRPAERAIKIDLSPWSLPGYTLLSLARGLAAYVLSLLFTLIYGYWAAKDRVAERVLIPVLDILQSIPVLGFMPGLVLALVAVFPGSNVGLELAAIVMIFTGQAWNMTFSFYHSVSSVPADLGEASTVYRFTAWQRFRWVEVPYSMVGLVWNSMMSMAGGWFFLMVTEAFRLGETDFRLPGIGSYMSVAVDAGRWDSMLWAILAMVLMIVGLDQLLWRPVVVWAQKFRIEEGGQEEAASSWLLDLLRRSRLVAAGSRLMGRLRQRLAAPFQTPLLSAGTAGSRKTSPWISRFSSFMFLLLLLVLSGGAWQLLGLLRQVSADTWLAIIEAAFATLVRVLLTVALGTLWALPVGLAIGLSPRLSRIFQPVVQVVASFPAPMLYAMVVPAMLWIGMTLNSGSVFLMLLGTQWYILFNVIAGAMAMPSDLREAARSYRILGWQRFKVLYFPVIFPYLVTGWVTAAGGAWNASIVAEFVTYKQHVLQTLGLGALISNATVANDYPKLAAGIVVMSIMVVIFNRSVWRRLYRLAETRFSLAK